MDFMTAIGAFPSSTAFDPCFWNNEMELTRICESAPLELRKMRCRVDRDFGYCKDGKHASETKTAAAAGLPHLLLSLKTPLSHALPRLPCRIAEDEPPDCGMAFKV